jgi:aminoglycoside phosphotransferase (APT) family kinase protein
MLDGMADPHPAMELVFTWLCENAPSDRETTLVHGDFRTGNFMLTPDGLSAILDWEFSHWGSPYYDLAWISVRDWRFGVLDRPIGGFSKREPFYQAYENASGRRVDRRLVHYWEVMGNLRWAGGAVYQGERYTRYGEEDLELVAIGRRACEMEWEALRLVERGRL